MAKIFLQKQYLHKAKVNKPSKYMPSRIFANSDDFLKTRQLFPGLKRALPATRSISACFCKRVAISYQLQYSISVGVSLQERAEHTLRPCFGFADTAESNGCRCVRRMSAGQLGHTFPAKWHRLPAATDSSPFEIHVFLSHGMCRVLISGT